MTPRSRRDFLSDVSKGVLAVSVGYGVARDLGLSTVEAGEAGPGLTFGRLESLVGLMQDTPANKLMPVLVEKINSGTPLKDLTAAGALANARTFGGEDYIGFHTIMAMLPAYHMSGELPKNQAPLPILKVLYRNTNRIQERGGRKEEVLHELSAAALPDSEISGEALQAAVRKKDLAKAEQILRGAAVKSPEEAFNALLFAVQDGTEVHRTVLPYRAWDMLNLVGREQAHTMLRQSVHYCVRNNYHNMGPDSPSTILPKMLEAHKLLGKELGTKKAEDGWVEQLSKVIFSGTPEQAANAAAAALAEGFAPDAVGEAISLAANQLILRDQGRRPREESTGKPIGSTHGDSIGVHACDSANAWRNMARVSNTRNTYACLTLGAYQVALDRGNRGGDFLNWQPLPVDWHLNQIKATDAATLLRDCEEAIRANLQARASAIVHKYGEQGHDARGVLDLMLKYAITEDGALHAEKYYRTVVDEFNSSRPVFRWRYLVSLARVTASEYGRPAPGVAEAKELLKV